MNESQADEIDKPVASSSEAAESLETDEDNGYHWLADDEIEYILDKLSPRDKARARLVCKTWCRVLSEPAFLLRDVNWMDFNNANLSQLRDCIMCLPVNGVYRLEHVRELVLTLPILHRESGKRQAYRMLCSALGMANRFLSADIHLSSSFLSFFLPSPWSRRPQAKCVVSFDQSVDSVKLLANPRIREKSYCSLGRNRIPTKSGLLQRKFVIHWVNSST